MEILIDQKKLTRSLKVQIGKYEAKLSLHIMHYFQIALCHVTMVTLNVLTYTIGLLLVHLLDVGKVSGLKVSEDGSCILNVGHTEQLKGFPHRSLASVNLTPVAHNSQTLTKEELNHYKKNTNNKCVKVTITTLGQ